MSVADIVSDIVDELDLDSNDTKTMRRVYRWLNSVYRNVVTAEQFPWRQRSTPILTKPVGTGTDIAFVYGSTSAANLVGGQDRSIDLHSKFNYCLVDGYDVPLELTNAVAYSGPSFRLILQLRNPFPFDSGTYDITVPHTRYVLDDIREDWITAIFNHTLDTPLTRIYPVDNFAYLQRAIKNAEAPMYYYLETVDENKSAVLCLAPAPDMEYELTVQTLLGAEELTSSTTTTILPPEYESDLLINGVAFLYSISRKDKSGVEYYSGLYNKVLDGLFTSAHKQPGRKRVMLGYLKRDVELSDPDIPKDWSY